MSETAETKVWTTKVVEDNGELVILFPPNLMKHVGWREGDNLAWVISEDGKQCFISKLQSPED